MNNSYAGTWIRGWMGGGLSSIGIDRGYGNTALRNNLKSHSVVSFYFMFEDECTSFRLFFFASFLFIILLIYYP